MFEAQLLEAPSNKAASVFGQWFQREGDNAYFTLDLIESSGVGVTVQVFTKNSEDKGSGSEVDSSISIASAVIGQHTQLWPSSSTKGFKEQVRFKFTIDAAAGASWALFRMIPNSWFNSVRP